MRFEVQMRHMGELLATWQCVSAEMAGNVVDCVMTTASLADYWRLDVIIVPTVQPDDDVKRDETE